MIQAIGVDIDSKEIKKLSLELSQGIDFSLFLLNIITELYPTGETHPDILINPQTGGEKELEIQDASVKKHIKQQIKLMEAGAEAQPLIEDSRDTKNNGKEQDKPVKGIGNKTDMQDKIVMTFARERDEDKIKSSEHINKVEPEKNSSSDDYERLSKENGPIDNIKPKSKIKDWPKQYKIIHKSGDDNIRVRWEPYINNEHADNNNKHMGKSEGSINTVTTKPEHIKKSVPTVKEAPVTKGVTLNIKPKSSSHYWHLTDTPVKPEHIDRADLINQLAEKIQFHVSKGNKEELIVNLKPEFLGRLKIRLISENGHIKVDLITENHIARDTINSHLPILQQVLIEQGLPVQEISLFINWQGYPENRRPPEYKSKTSYLGSKDVGSAIGPASSHKKVKEIEDAGYLDYWA